MNSLAAPPLPPPDGLPGGVEEEGQQELPGVVDQSNGDGAELPQEEREELPQDIGEEPRADEEEELPEGSSKELPREDNKELPAEGTESIQSAATEDPLFPSEW